MCVTCMATHFWIYSLYMHHHFIVSWFIILLHCTCSWAEAGFGCRWTKERVSRGEEEWVWELRWGGAWWFVNSAYLKAAEGDEIIHCANSVIHLNSSYVPEQNERTRESTEQWREFHYDGMHPPHEYNRHSIWERELWDEEWPWKLTEWNFQSLLVWFFKQCCWNLF